MYSLTLSKSERDAIDWVGGRYTNGENLYHLLWVHSDCSPSDADWDYDGHLTFDVPEHVAWQIRVNAESEDGFWPCFAPELAQKMQQFVDSIV